MKKIFEHIDFSRVGHFQALLEDAGIVTTMRNQFASVAAGEIPLTEVWPELWIVNESDFARAEEVLEAYKDSDFKEGTPWTCPKCKEAVGKEFGECWNCQTERPAGQ